MYLKHTHPPPPWGLNGAPYQSNPIWCWYFIAELTLNKHWFNVSCLQNSTLTATRSLRLLWAWITWSDFKKICKRSTFTSSFVAYQFVKNVSKLHIGTQLHYINYTFQFVIFITNWDVITNRDVTIVSIWLLMLHDRDTDSRVTMVTRYTAAML